MVALRREAALLVGAVRSYPLLSLLFTGLALAIVGFGVLVGGVPAFAVYAALVVLVALAVLRWRWGRVGEETRGQRRRAALVTAVLTGVGMLGLIQAVPYGRAHANPPVTGEPQWATPETRELMERACYQCHSNLVEYPWYSNVAPMSWAVESHVNGGRSEVNYSEFATDPRNADESIEEILDGSMPPSYFTRFGLNAAADLTDAEIATLVEGLRATPGFAEKGGGGGD
jgi:hypothetical protein